MPVQPIPKGYHTVTPCLTVSDAEKAIAFYKQAFNAVEKYRFTGPDNKIMHAEIMIGDSPIMLGSECAERGNKSPKTLGGSPMSIYLYISNLDSMFEQALKAGATLKHPIENKFYGDRSGAVEDPFGYHWHLATHIEDVSPEEMKKRTEEMWNNKKSTPQQ
jgi:PhnB protein